MICAGKFGDLCCSIDVPFTSRGKFVICVSNSCWFRGMSGYLLRSFKRSLLNATKINALGLFGLRIEGVRISISPWMCLINSFLFCYLGFVFTETNKSSSSPFQDQARWLQLPRGFLLAGLWFTLIVSWLLLAHSGGLGWLWLPGVSGSLWPAVSGWPWLVGSSWLAIAIFWGRFEFSLCILSGIKTLFVFIVFIIMFSADITAPVTEGNKLKWCPRLQRKQNKIRNLAGWLVASGLLAGCYLLLPVAACWMLLSGWLAAGRLLARKYD